MERSVVIVATAGHIDHGKTSLVRALTGVDLDTAPEERERGITISLGFTALELEERRVAFVDCPGHERLVRTMASGAHGVDAAILVVSADDGVMPQTREHLAVLSLLGIDRGAVVLSKADLVDEELLELAEADVEETVEGTFLEGAPVFPVSSVTGLGLDALKAFLAEVEPRDRSAEGPFRLAVDRAFVRAGFGTVVTGTSSGGSLRDGSAVTLLPEGTAARVRGLQIHGEDAEVAGGGLRVALNLSGIDKEQVPRGTVVVGGEVPCPSIVDVQLRHVHPEVPLEDGMSVRVLLGTAERIARVYLAGEHEALMEGDEAYGQLRLDAPLPCLPGDRFVLRRVSPVVTLGGGVVLDPWARKMRARDRARVEQELDRLHDGDKLVWLERAGPLGVELGAWAARAPGVDGVVLGPAVVAPAVCEALEARLVEGLTAYHAAHPLARGAPRRELHTERLGHLPDKMFDALLAGLSGRGVVVLDGPLVWMADWSVALSAAQEALRDGIAAAVRAAGMVGAQDDELAKVLGSGEVGALLRLLEAEGAVTKVPNLGWVAAETLAELKVWFAGSVQAGELLTPAAFRDAFGLNRKTTIPWLTYTDRIGWTRRTGEGRTLGPGIVG